MVKVQVKWGKESYDVEVDPSLGLEVFQATLFSLTNVPIERQKVMVKGKLIKTADDMTKNLSDGAKVMLMGSADEIKQAPTTKIVFEEDLTEAQKVQLVPEAVSAGLENLGNTCYMNSTLQSLRAIPELKQALLKYSNATRGQSGLDGSHSITSSMGQLFQNMDSTSKPVTPFVFTNAFRTTFPQFAERSAEGHYQQQDADECLSQLMSAMASRLETGTGESKENLIDELFGGMMETSLTCTETDAEEPIHGVEKFRKIRCHIGAKTNFMVEGIQEDMNEPIERRSPTLGRNAIYNRRFAISQLPKNLIVQFVRFFWKQDVKKKAKILRKVEFPIKLDILPLVNGALKGSLGAARRVLKEEEDSKLGIESIKRKGIPESSTTSSSSSSTSSTSTSSSSSSTDSKSDKPDNKDKSVPMDIDPIDHNAPPNAITSGYYELYAVVTHKGRSADGGHYVGWVKQIGDNWIKFDDAEVSTVKEEEIKGLCGGGDWHTSYINLYRRIDDMPAYYERQAKKTTTATATPAATPTPTTVPAAK